MKINRKDLTKKWYKYKGKVEFEVRPFPMSELKSFEALDSLKDQFMYCLVSWKGILDEDDTELKVNDENKLLLYNYYADVREFVYEKNNKTTKRLDKDLKN